MATTGSPFNLPYPLISDEVNVHGDIQALAEGVATALTGLAFVNNSNTFASTNTFSVTSANPAITITQSGSGAAISSNGKIIATEFEVSGGLSTQFLKADGSFDSSTYLTTSNASTTYLTQNNASNTYATKSDPGFTGNMSLHGPSNNSISIGRIDGTSSTPYIDFNSGSTLADYDARILAIGGDGSSGGGNLELAAADVLFRGTISFEGSTANNFETKLQVTDPTADRTITFPDATGTVVLETSTGINLGNNAVAQTKSVDDNTTSVATTAFVINQGYLKSVTAGNTYQPKNDILDGLSTATLTNSGFIKTDGSNFFTVDQNTYLTANQSITLSGAITGSGSTAITASINTSTSTPTFSSNSYTAQLSDAAMQTILLLNNGSTAANFVINSSVSFPIGSQINVIQTGSGQITVTADGTTNLRSQNGLKLKGQYAGATCVKISSTDWVVVGNTTT